ncbi:MAG: hypothetical protein JWN82_329 [Candidatus Saccharibacteria bacterium]|nr:hypothetical protein [Candidatus Saccharibacteria bacterium]
MILGGEAPQQFERLDANHVASLRRYIAYRKQVNTRNDAAHPLQDDPAFSHSPEPRAEIDAHEEQARTAFEQSKDDQLVS